MSGLPFTEIGIAVGRDQRYGSDKVIIYAKNLVTEKSVNGTLDASTNKKQRIFLNSLSIVLHDLFQFQF
jgi:DUF2075 family protein